MSDETTPPEGGTTPVTPVTPPPQTTAPEQNKSGAVDSGEGDKPKVFDEAYVKDLRAENAEWRKKTRDLEKRLQDIESTQSQAKEAELKEQQKWQQLAEKYEKEKLDLVRQLETERLTSLKAKVGNDFKLPSALVARLQGATEDELRADAAELAKELGLDKPAPTEPPQQPEPEQTQKARRPSTTTAVPGGQTVGRTDADRRAARENRTSPIFDTSNAGGAVTKGSRLTKRTYP
jgi:hypothetical protein